MSTVYTITMLDGCGIDDHLWTTHNGCGLNGTPKADDMAALGFWNRLFPDAALVPAPK